MIGSGYRRNEKRVSWISGLRRGVHGGLSIAGFWSIMKRQVRLLLTRLSTSLHSRSIRGVARTLAIIALLSVSLLIVGADAFAQGEVIQIYGALWCGPCRSMKMNLNLDPGYYGPSTINGQNVNFVDAGKAGYVGTIPAAVINGKTVIGADEILKQLEKGAEKKNENKQIY